MLLLSLQTTFLPMNHPKSLQRAGSHAHKSGENSKILLRTGCKKGLIHQLTHTHAMKVTQILTCTHNYWHMRSHFLLLFGAPPVTPSAACSRTLAHTHTHTRTHTQTHTHKHTLTHTRAHTLPPAPTGPTSRIPNQSHPAASSLECPTSLTTHSTYRFAAAHTCIRT